MILEWWHVLLILAGFLAGIVNTVAGGGSFLTLPALMYVANLDPQIANATNRIAILFSSATASATFNKHGHLNKKLVLHLAIPTLMGVPLGASLAYYLPPSAFKPAIGLIFLAMAIVLILNPNRLLKKKEVVAQPTWIIFLTFFAIGFYVGFIQAGMGILLLLAMTLLNTGNLVDSNGVKNAIGFIVTLLAASCFVFFRQVEFVPGLIMAIGNILGGYIGAKLAIKKGNKLIFGFLVLVMIATSLNLLLG